MNTITNEISGAVRHEALANDNNALVKRLDEIFHAVSSVGIGRSGKLQIGDTTYNVSIPSFTEIKFLDLANGAITLELNLELNQDKDDWHTCAIGGGLVLDKREKLLTDEFGTSCFGLTSFNVTRRQFIKDSAQVAAAAAVLTGLPRVDASSVTSERNRPNEAIEAVEKVYRQFVELFGDPQVFYAQIQRDFSYRSVPTTGDIFISMEKRLNEGRTIDAEPSPFLFVWSMLSPSGEPVNVILRRNSRRGSLIISVATRQNTLDLSDALAGFEEGYGANNGTTITRLDLQGDGASYAFFVHAPNQTSRYVVPGEERINEINFDEHDTLDTAWQVWDVSTSGLFKVNNKRSKLGRGQYIATGRDSYIGKTSVPFPTQYILPEEAYMFFTSPLLGGVLPLVPILGDDQYLLWPENSDIKPGSFTVALSDGPLDQVPGAARYTIIRPGGLESILSTMRVAGTLDLTTEVEGKQVLTINGDISGTDQKVAITISDPRFVDTVRRNVTDGNKNCVLMLGDNGESLTITLTRPGSLTESYYSVTDHLDDLYPLDISIPGGAINANPEINLATPIEAQ
jgi:hypothetical protein